MADPATVALQQLGGEWIAGNHGVRVCGWIVYTRKSPILSGPERSSWEEQLGTHHLPDMLFGNSCLELIHEATGVVISFNAKDALQGWLQEKSPPVQVSSASEWQKRQDVRRDKVLDYDYTYTTPYTGTLVRRMLCAGDGCGHGHHSDPSKGHGHSHGHHKDHGQHGHQHKGHGHKSHQDDERHACGGASCAHDAGAELSRELSSSNASTSASSGHAADDGHAHGHSLTLVDARGPAGVDWQVQLPDASGLDMSLLTGRDPILFYDERVMPKFWFVLLRYWLRVDGMLMRIRDTRLFCPFPARAAANSITSSGVADGSGAAAPAPAGGGSSAQAPAQGWAQEAVVYRECTNSEETFASLAQRGLAADSLAYVDSAAAAQVMLPGAKSCAKLVLAAHVHAK
eukprot:jgi/Mesvir1/9726/Mv12194-RA.2